MPVCRCGTPDLARHADPRTTEHYDRARGDLDRHGVHFLTAYVAGV
jgi:integrase/recombinase XerD